LPWGLGEFRSESISLIEDDHFFFCKIEKNKNITCNL